MNAPILHTMQKLAYDSTAGTLLSAGRGNPNIQTAHKCQLNVARKGAIFSSFFRVRFYGGLCGARFGVAGSRLSRFPPPHGLPPNPVERTVAAPTIKRSQSIMTPFLRLKSALSPSVTTRAKAHRAMALAALRSDTSLKNRLSRYNYHSEKARQLENVGGVQ